MAGDTDNVSVWAEADVLVGPVTATIPTTGADFAVDWEFVGILDGSAGFGESQSNDATDFNGWGYGVVASSRKNLAITRTFTMLEDNETTQGLRYDTSGVTYSGGGYTGTLRGRDLNEKFRIGFELRQGTTLKRMISSNYAQIESIGDVTEGEDNTSSFPVTVKIYPDSDGEYWTVFKGAAV